MRGDCSRSPLSGSRSETAAQKGGPVATDSQSEGLKHPYVAVPGLRLLCHVLAVGRWQRAHHPLPMTIAQKRFHLAGECDVERQPGGREEAVPVRGSVYERPELGAHIRKFG